jgi:hypothetical protein
MPRPSSYNADRTAKRCSQCKIEKPIVAFQMTGKRNRAGEMSPYLRAECKVCNGMRAERWAKANPDKVRATHTRCARNWRSRNLIHYRNYQAIYHRAYDKAHPERRAAARHKAYLKRKERTAHLGTVPVTELPAIT